MSRAHSAPYECPQLLKTPSKTSQRRLPINQQAMNVGIENRRSRDLLYKGVSGDPALGL